MKCQPYQVVKDELLKTEDHSNVEMDQLIGDVGIIMTETMLKKLEMRRRQS